MVLILSILLPNMSICVWNEDDTDSDTMVEHPGLQVTYLIPLGP